MADDQKNPLGPVGNALASNLARIRDAQRLTYVALAERLADAGRPIAVLGLRRIEKGERRVDADDLLALAQALGIHPVDLLVPGDAPSDEQYEITPTTATTAGVAREWIGGRAFLAEPESDSELVQALRCLPVNRAAQLNRAWWTRDQ